MTLISYRNSFYRLLRNSMVIILCLITSSIVWSQQIKKDSLFLQYLLSKEEQADAITLLSQLQQRYPESVQHSFELPYWKGLSYYSLKQLDSATHYFTKVKPSSPFYQKTLFLSAISHSYLKNVTKAEEIISTFSTSDSLRQATKTFELAGMALLQRNMPRFDSLSKHFSTSYYPLQKQQDNFRDYKSLIQQQGRKSPLKAALLSAIVPGAGKLYVGGQLGQGVSTFIQNMILGLQAYEGLRKDGVGSPRFIIYGSLFSLFYLGNIWGSAISVSIKRQEFNDKMNEQILFDMHIPLRTIFN